MSDEKKFIDITPNYKQVFATFMRDMDIHFRGLLNIQDPDELERAYRYVNIVMLCLTWMSDTEDVERLRSTLLEQNEKIARRYSALMNPDLEDDDAEVCS